MLGRRIFKNMSPTRAIALTFAAVILIGATLLCFPFSSRSGEWTNFLNALFTATSATCVTGLIVYDTYSHWSLFGKLVILTMIQIGGLGLMTFITMLSIFMKKKISLHERKLLIQSAGTIRYQGVVRLVRNIFLGTFIIEGIGAVLLFIRFVRQMDVISALGYSVFHSISAFCNAGFDLMGKYKPFSSFTAYETDYYVSIVLASLLIIGGIGFLVWEDIKEKKWHFSKYRLHSKLVLCTTAFLLAGGTLGFLIFEYHGNLQGYSLPHKLLSSFFMSATTRTAGFNTMELSTLSEAGSLFASILMLIGGSPGSTAGGIKTVTVTVLVLSSLSMAKGQSEVTVFKKRLDASVVKHAAVIPSIYVIAVALATSLLCHFDGLSLTDAFFEAASAAGTAGLTRGITTSLSAASRIILIILMFGGRLGGLSLAMVFGEQRPQPPTRRPTEKIVIG